MFASLATFARSQLRNNLTAIIGAIQKSMSVISDNYNYSVLVQLRDQ